MGRPNLTVLTNAMERKVTIERNRSTGAETCVRGQIRQFTASTEWWSPWELFTALKVATLLWQWLPTQLAALAARRSTPSRCGSHPLEPPGIHVRMGPTARDAATTSGTSSAPPRWGAIGCPSSAAASGSMASDDSR